MRAAPAAERIVSPREILEHEVILDRFETRGAGLFPQAADHRSEPGGLQEHVMGRLVELAKSDELMITEILQEDARIWSIAGKAITGIVYDPENQKEEYQPHSIPDELVNYPVVIECIDTSMKTIRWKGPMKSVGRKVKRGNGSTRKVSVLRSEFTPRWFEVPGPRAILSIQDAWLCLRQLGQYCSPAPSSDIRKANWKIREVPPAGHPLAKSKK